MGTMCNYQFCVRQKWVKYEPNYMYLCIRQFMLHVMNSEVVRCKMDLIDFF